VINKNADALPLVNYPQKFATEVTFDFMYKNHTALGISLYMITHLKPFMKPDVILISTTESFVY